MSRRLEKRVGVLRAKGRAHSPVLAAALVATVWTAQALTAPARTYHLLPVLAAAAWPVTARLLRGRASWAAALRAGAGGFAVAVLTAVELAVVDALRGPAMVGGSALGESLLGAAVGAALGSWVLAASGPGPLPAAVAPPAPPTVD
ncbi:MAG: hypothetical protein Q8K72_02520 [Acidimicrobiales bacterium]|nr:hypothetical protein [Acidimicrobiales bacterium]